jgi:hypothetical protein
MSILLATLVFVAPTVTAAAQQGGAEKPAAKQNDSKYVKIRDIVPKRVRAGAPVEVTITAGVDVPYQGLEVKLVRLTPQGMRGAEIPMEHVGDRPGGNERLFRARVTIEESTAGKATFQVRWSARTPQMPVGESGRPFDIRIDPPAKPGK